MNADGGDAGKLPDAMERCIGRFSHEGWRERKQAVSLLVDLVVHEQPDADTMHRLIERLIDGVVHPVTVSSRAACQEALERLGRASVPHIVDRIRRRAEGARLLIDLVGALGTAAEVPLLIELAAQADDENMRASAAAALGQLAEVGGLESQRVLESMLDEDSQMLQLYALDALRTAESRVAVERLAPLVERPVTRKAAVAVLGNSESFEALPLLLPLLDEPMLGVRAAVVRSLQRLHRSMSASGQRSAVQEALANLGPDEGHRFENQWLARGLPFNEGDVDGAFVDFDNDGRLDISISRDRKYEGNFEDADQKSWFGLMHQLPTGAYESLGVESGINDPDEGLLRMKGAQNHAWSDVDHDGDLDLLVGGRDQGGGRPNFLFRNDVGQNQGWLAVRVEGDGEVVTRDAIGTRVTLRSGDELRMREKKSSRGMYNSEDTRVLHFGLGGMSCEGRSLEVRWPDGTTASFDETDFTYGTYVTLRYPDELLIED